MGVNKTYNDELIVFLKCNCDKASRLKPILKTNKKVLLLKAVKNSINNQCLNISEKNNVFNNFKSLTSCNLNISQVVTPPSASDLIYFGNYAYGAAIDNQDYTSSAPSQISNAEELALQIETNIDNYNITEQLLSQTIGVVFNINTLDQFGSHFIAVPASVNINIFDITNTNVTNSFTAFNVEINGIDYVVYMLPNIVSPNSITSYYVI